MLTKLGGVLQGWMGTPLRSGLIFWLGGLGLWIVDILNGDAFWKLWQGTPLAAKERLVTADWLPLWDFLHKMREADAAIALLGFIGLMLLLSTLVKYVEFKVLRLLEGYGWPESLRTWATEHYETHTVAPKQSRWKALAKKEANPDTPLTMQEQWEYAELDRELVLIPEEGLRMPTRIGNLLRGYEQRPREKYGLDMIICWSRLWLLLPKETQEELSAARNALDEAVQIFVWGMLFVVWCVWVWWLAIPIALLLMLAGYYKALQAADICGQLLEAAFDVHRDLLYQSLKWPAPKNPADEKTQGQALTAYLWRGLDSEQPVFATEKNDKS